MAAAGGIDGPRSRRPNWWGLLVVVLGALQLLVATLGVELSTARAAFVITLIGSVWLLGGTLMLRKAGLSAVSAVLHDSDSGRHLQPDHLSAATVASWLAATALSALDIPVLRDGNILDLPSGRWLW